ncbi:MAG TPA: hypothetical protein VFA65_08360 [Bryobacteraceae bacterium]|nr:hypothetical protein [Bryobacteraceae bacterium]
MATPDNIIRVPKPGREAYDPHRPLSKNTLIKHQVEHFHEAEKNLPLELQTGIDITTIKTEGQAGDYIRKVTTAIHKSGGVVEKVRKAT